MKICLINNLFRPIRRGGADRVVEMIAEGLKARGHEVVVIATRPFEQQPRDPEFKVYWLGGLCSIFHHLKRLPAPLRLLWHFANLFNVASFFRVRAILRREKPALVLTHNLMGVGFLIPFAIKSLKITHGHTLHDIQLLHPSGLLVHGREQLIESFFAKAYQAITRRLFLKPQLIVSPSRWLIVEHLEKKFFTESAGLVLPNPIDEADLADFNPRQDKRAERFLFVGEIENHKGVPFMVKAFMQLGKGYELNLVGKGSQLDEIKRLAANNGQIKILGWVENKKLKASLKDYDAILVPSLCYENSPTVIYEAFANGLTVIASDIGGISELLADGCGLAYAPADEEALLKRIKWVSENTSTLAEMRIKARNKISDFTVENYFNKLFSNLPK